MYCHKKTIFLSLATCAAAACLSYAQDKKASPAVTPASYTESKEWPTYGHDSGGMRYSPLKQITPANVSNLKIAWTYHLKPENYVAPAGGRGGGGFGGRGASGAEGAPGAAAGGALAGGRGGGGRGGNTGFRATEVTPLVANGTMYIASPYGQVVALDPTSGKEVWVYKLPAGDDPATRGVEYFAG